MPDTLAAALPALTLTRDGPLPLHAQVAEALRGAILSGRLPPQTRLPATRVLAQELGLGRNTVADAYAQLTAEGYLEARVGAGTHVADIAPDALLNAGAAQVEETEADQPPPLSGRGEALAAAFRPAPPVPGRYGYAFQPGVPAFDAFPISVWARVSARAAKNVRAVGGYESAWGLPALREGIANHVRLSRGVVCEPEQVIVTAGAQAALDLAARLLTDPGDPVWIEDPGYGGARGAFVGADAKMIPVPLDEEGIDLAAARRTNTRPRVIYVTPSHQFPLGITMSLNRRLALLEEAANADAWIMEDDYDSEYRYQGRPLSSLQGLDGGRRVLYVGTWSKTFFPSLRIGYLVVPQSHVSAFRSAIRNTGHAAPSLPQMALADFLHGGHYDAHTRRMRKLYDARRRLLLDTIKREAGDILTPTEREAGMQFPAFFKKSRDDRAASEALAKAEISAASLTRYTLDEKNRRPGLLLGFAAVEERHISPAARKLAEVLRAS